VKPCAWISDEEAGWFRFHHYHSDAIVGLMKLPRLDRPAGLDLILSRASILASEQAERPASRARAGRGRTTRSERHQATEAGAAQRLVECRGPQARRASVPGRAGVHSSSRRSARRDIAQSPRAPSR
jgi:hypothetical protein